MRRQLAVLALCLLVVVLANGPNKIDNLPGAPPIKFNQYAGYVTVNATAGRNLFYWFVESQNDPASDPLVLWLNGGPGCSSLEGLLTENGPFWPNADGKTLFTNPYSWNTVANVVYLESPAGVGFSYSEDPNDYTVGDKRTAADSVIFLHQFLTMYPQFAKNPFWITGESYGGHYVPNLALAVLNANKAGAQPHINLQGFQVGNAWSVAALDNAGAVFDWWSHGIISDDTYDGMNQACDYASIGPLKQESSKSAAAAAAAATTVEATAEDPSKECDYWNNEANADMATVNIYALLADVCLSSDEQAHHMRSGERLVHAVNAAHPQSPFPRNIGTQRKRLEQQQQQQQQQQSSAAPSPAAQQPAPSSSVVDQDPCIGNYLYTYLNQPDVRTALHTNISYAWVGCSNLIDYSYTDLLSSMIPVYRALLDDGSIRMLVYSGDMDGIVPITGTRSWLSTLQLPVVDAWRPYLVNKQTGGWTEQYQGLTFASVRGAGHMVPGTQPARSLYLFTQFLRGLPL